MTILCYHGIDPTWRSPLAVTPAAFDDHCEWLARHRHVLALEAAVERLDRTGRLPRGTTAITFDDGFRNVVQHALPALRRHGLPATVFVVAETLTPAGRVVDWVDTPPDDDALETLTLEELRELQDGGVTIGSHSYSHRILTTLSPKECEDDLRRSRELLEDLLERPVPFVAYPRGYHDEAVRDAAARAGFKNGFSLPETPEARGPFAVPRVGVYPGNDTRALGFKTGRWYLPARTGRTYPWIRLAIRGSRPPSRRAG